MRKVYMYVYIKQRMDKRQIRPTVTPRKEEKEKRMRIVLFDKERNIERNKLAYHSQRGR